MTNFLLSIVIPVFNEKDNIQPLLKRLLPIISHFQYELIFVDDGSIDPTPKLIKEEAKTNQKIKLISFQRNFGHQMALTAGYQKAQGNCVITLDSDLQDPPEIIKDMILKWQQGAKIVYAQRKKREVDSFLKKTTAQIFYKFINFLSDTRIPDDVGDFRLLDRTVVDFINNLHEQSRFLRGLVAWGGFPAQYVFFDREKRHSGETHYPFSKMLNFALEGIVSFSTKPLRLASYLGFLTGFIGFLGIVYAIIGKLFFTGYLVSGWTAIFVGIMFLGGVQLITIGIIGEYIGKIYQEVQRKPPFLIKETINL